MNKAKQELLKSTLITLAVLATTVLVMGINSVVQAWSEPTAPPTEGNVAAPLNVSSSTQRKEGRLHLDPDNIQGDLNENDSLSVYAENNSSGLYVQQRHIGSGQYDGVTAYFKHENTTTNNPDPDAHTPIFDLYGGYAVVADGHMKITGDLIVMGNSYAGGKALGASTSFSAFQCQRDNQSCGTKIATTCQEKCLNSTNPGSGFCGSAWLETAEGYLKNFTCDDSTNADGTVICNCLSFD